MVSRFVAEARAVTQIRHRYIIDIFGFGQLPDGRHYYVMEFLEGMPLDQHIDQSGPLPLGEAVSVLRGVARALDAAHAKGIAHRDLKPENVFLVIDEQGGATPKLLDFGIAKLLSQTGSQPMFKTRTGAPIGTPYYMSPEQCRGRDVDHRTDIYAFGCVAYRMLTATFPFDGEDYMEILMKQISNEPVPASTLVAGLPPAVDEAISWMLKKDPAGRPPNLVTAVRALEQAAVAAGVAVPTDVANTAQIGARTGPMGGASRTPSAVAPLPGSGRADAMADTIGSVDAATPVPGTLPGAARGRGKGVWIALAAVLVVGGGGGALAYMKMQEGKKEARPEAKRSPSRS
jgi:serine/threonine-protein kinase